MKSAHMSEKNEKNESVCERSRYLDVKHAHHTEVKVNELALRSHHDFKVEKVE